MGEKIEVRGNPRNVALDAYWDGFNISNRKN
jgi:hypothetical protein